MKTTKKDKILAQEDCIHGIWPPSSCTLCTGKDIPVATESWTFIVARWEAKFPAKCYRCGDDISVGDQIAQDTEDNHLCEKCST